LTWGIFHVQKTEVLLGGNQAGEYTFRQVGIIKGPLFKRDISANKTYQPAVLLVKLLNDSK
jgi:hypothetical protein